jgi:hypothetical protein
MYLLFTAISALLPIKLAEDAQCRKEANLLIANVAIKFMMETLGSENLEIVGELQTPLKLHIMHRRTNLLQDLQYFQSETQDNSELFPRLSKDTTAKITLCVIKCLSPSENDGQNSTFFSSVALRPNAGHGLLIHEVSRSHTTTHHSR